MEGLKCDQCRADYFYLSHENPVGCIQCFCSGLSSNCSSAIVYRETEQTVFVLPHANPSMGWRVSSVDGSDPTTAGFVVTNIITDQMQLQVSLDLLLIAYPVYWFAPDKFRGNKLSSYGGDIRYAIWYNVGGSVVGSLTNDSDLIVVGNGRQAHHYLSALPVQNRVETISVQIKEQSFVNENGSQLTRDELETILAHIDLLLIRATYHNGTNEVALMNFTMDISSSNIGGARVETVEQCTCPAAYSGYSCESCATGSTRFGSLPSSDALLGTCTSCVCNNHADACHEITGECIGCEDNTYGNSCEFCASGFYGDATQGTDKDCVVCPCSVPKSTSTNCLLGPSGPICNCSVGYQGLLCDECQPNYFGDPQSSGGVCTQCGCNGNINTTDPNSCNRSTGMCVNCLYNTEGLFCERCAVGYYGDAPNQNCQGSIFLSCFGHLNLLMLL